jgi:hypothetical protein
MTVAAYIRVLSEAQKAEPEPAASDDRHTAHA